MKKLMSAVRSFSYVMHVISGILLILMVITVLVDVATRLVFGMSGGAVNLTFPGGVEIVRYSLLLMVLFTLPYSVSRGQVVVDLFTENLPERVKGLMTGVFLIGFALLGFGMATRFYHAIWNAMSSGETTQDLLLPIWYFYALASFATTVLALRSLFVSVDYIIYGRSSRS
jgi:TRAP-type C4-dicarboxylate transport system permease small subunit